MLSIAARGSGPAATAYFLQMQADRGALEDYYATEGDGQWYGAGAVTAGLAGTVEQEAFAALAAGMDPKNGNPLVQGAGDKHRAGWDLTFSAPKSVSIQWGCGAKQLREEIQVAHDRAVRTALDLASKQCIKARRGHAGEYEEAADPVLALFRHGTSRELDPQLHTHCFVFNCARRRDGSWGGIQSRHMYQWKMALGAIYRAELARQLQRLGFEIQRDGKSFRISGVREDVERAFSQRRAQIQTALAKHGTSSARAAEAAALDTREKKQDVPIERLLTDWRRRADALNFTASGVPRTFRGPLDPPSTKTCLSGMTDTASTVSLPQLYAAVATESQGALDALGVDALVQGVVEDSECVRLRAADGSTRFSSLQMLQLEEELVRQAWEVAGRTTHPIASAIRDRILKKAPDLSSEQRTAVSAATTPAGLALWEGAPGSGKTSALKVAAEIWAAGGYQVQGAALSGKAAQGLGEGAGIPVRTVFHLLKELESNPDMLRPQDVVILDEAGMVGSRDMARLVEHIARAGAKLVLVGDSKQLQPIDAGGAFRALAANIGATPLREIRRQRKEWARQAVMQLGAGAAGDAVRQFEERGLLKTAGGEHDLLAALVQDWVSAGGLDAPSSHLILAPTRADCQKLNQLVRARLAKAGKLGESAIAGEVEFAEGDRVQCLRNRRVLGVMNGTRGTIRRVLHHTDSIRLMIDTDDGRRVFLDPMEYPDLEHGYAVTVHKAQGVTVDHAYVLANECMSDREWTYVAASRARNETRIYMDKWLKDEVVRVMSRSRPKDTTTEYEVLDNTGQPTTSVEHQP